MIFASQRKYWKTVDYLRYNEYLLLPTYLFTILLPLHVVIFIIINDSSRIGVLFKYIDTHTTSLDIDITEITFLILKNITEITFLK